MNTVINVILYGIIVERITEIIVDSKIFEPVRNYLQTNSKNRVINFVSEMVKCGYCTSVWVAFFVSLFLDLGIFPNPLAAWFFDAVLIHGVANFWHVLYMNTWKTKVKYHNVTLYKTNDPQQ
jgi:hypothetical protein